MRVYKEGSKETIMVKAIQKALGLKADGIFGPNTRKAVIEFQMSNYLVADGIVGPATLEALDVLDTDQNSKVYKTDLGLSIEQYFLPESEYVTKDFPIKNDYCILHHTSGWHNPYNVIDGWAKDSRGRIATEFVIGGRNVVNGMNDGYDGVTLQAFPTGSQGYHLGKTKSYYMNRHSVGIELTSFGYLNQHNCTYTGVKAHTDAIENAVNFRGFDAWHRYSDAQLHSLSKLLKHVADRDSIDIRAGLVQWILSDGVDKAFGYYDVAALGEVKGLLSHGNVRKDKTDVFPQQSLVDMLLSL